MVAGMKFLEIDNSSLSRVTNVAGRFSCTKAAWSASIGLKCSFCLDLVSGKHSDVIGNKDI